MPTQNQIDDVLALCYEQIDSGKSKYYGMTFEEGVEQAIRWMQDESDEPPMEEEE